MITNMQLLAMGVSATVTILVPIVLLVMWKMKTRAPMSAAVVGGVVFALFVLVLEQAFHRVMLTAGSPVLRSAWSYVLYAALTAAIFEEVGRLLSFRFVLRRHTGRETGVMYGIGHGGVESIALCGVSMLAYLYLSWVCNTSGGQIPSDIIGVVGSLMMLSPGALVLPALERLMALALQIALSVLVFQAVQRPDKKRCFLAAVALHAGVDAIPAMYQAGILTSVALTELLLAGMTLVICWWVNLVYLRDWREEEEPEEEVLPDEAPAGVIISEPVQLALTEEEAQAAVGAANRPSEEAHGEAEFLAGQQAERKD